MGPIGLIAGMALAQEPTTLVPPSEEVVVWGKLAEDRARDALVRRMKDLGYGMVRRSDGEIVFQPEARWTGRARFDAEGALTFGRSVAGFRAPPEDGWTPPPGHEPALGDPMQVGIGPSFWLLPSKKKLRKVHEAVIEATHAEVDGYLAVRRRTEIENQLQLLPERLDALWSDGLPLVPGKPTIVSADDRRRAVLAYWATRAHTAEGGRVAAAVEAWLSAVVQSSEHPITDVEREEFLRPDEHVLP